jgi:hypothetical protein
MLAERRVHRYDPYCLLTVHILAGHCGTAGKSSNGSHYVKAYGYTGSPGDCQRFHVLTALGCLVLNGDRSAFHDGSLGYSSVSRLRYVAVSSGD